MPSEVIAINDATVFKRRLGKMRKNGTRGKDRVSIEVEAEPLAHYFDARIGAPIAEAIKELVAEQIRDIRETVPALTLEARRIAQRAWDRGAPWAKKRYSGGRMGPTPPRSGQVRAFNHSGRLAQGLFTRFNRGDGSFTTNVPANRFSQDVFSPERRKEAFNKLARLVPALSRPGAIFRDKRVRDATEKSVELMIQKLRDERALKRAELRRAVIDVGKTIAGLAL